EAPGRLASESTLLRGFRSAGLVDAFPTFAMTMDAVLEGLTCSLEIHPPPCRRVRRDEAMLLALCGLAQGRIDRPLAASLATLLTPDVAVVVAERLTSFMTQLDAAGLRLVPMVGEGPGVLH
ncbi:hypothetical protein WHJ50_14530, partial [Staphylococcus aureus]|uniref:hypothetical protein n=1 Tax=Staphylococcus aureus TaxID=1280 RepID=UPI0039BEAFF6